MACISIPIPTLPTLPAPLSITPPTIPPLPGLPSLCCKLPPLPIRIPPIPIPALVLNPAIIATLNAYIQTATDFINALPLKCPVQ